MVKKLFKHEFIYYLRTLVIFLPIMLLTGISTFFINLFKTDSPIYNVIFAGTISILLIASIACILVTVILGIVRFYKNMYSVEGYLTFTLPVTASEHLLVKLVVYLIVEAVSVFVVLLSWYIAFCIYSKDIFMVIGALFEFLGMIKFGHLFFYIIEVLLIFVTSIAYTPLLFYTCISIGQLAKKNKILLSVGAYYIYYVGLQAITTFFYVFVMIAGLSGSFETVAQSIALHPYGSMHIIFLISILVVAGLDVLLFFINKFIMTKKLNLE